MTVLSCGASKGGVGKTFTSSELAAVLSTRSRVAFVSLDSNRSGHDRLVQPHHRQDPQQDTGMVWEPGDRLWPDDRRLNHLLTEDPEPDLEGRYLYRRDDLPNLAMLFHETGSLTSLAAQLNDPRVRKRFRRLMDYLQDAYDWVVVDHQPSFENQLVGEVLVRSDLMLPVTDLSAGGVTSIKETFSTMVHFEEAPVHGLVITPYHRMNRSESRRAEEQLEAYAERWGLELLRIQMDSTVSRSQQAVTPLAVYRPEELRLASGLHPFDRDPPAALRGVQQVARWLEQVADDPDAAGRWDDRIDRYRAAAGLSTAAGRL